VYGQQKVVSIFVACVYGHLGPATFAGGQGLQGRMVGQGGMGNPATVSCTQYTTFVLCDDLKQDAEHTYAALRMVLQEASSRLLLKRVRIWSDGCCAQFKSGLNVAAHSILAHELGVWLQWCYGATSHFKGLHDPEGH
jgi:hypothetical protein